MKKLLILMMSGVVSLAAMAGDIVVQDARVKSSLKHFNGSTGALMDIINHSNEDDVLLSASSPVAMVVQLHKTLIKDGVAIMEEQKNGIVVPANDRLRLVQGGAHIMFMGIQHDIMPDDTVPITLSFAKHGDVKVQAKVFKTFFKR